MMERQSDSGSIVGDDVRSLSSLGPREKDSSPRLLQKAAPALVRPLWRRRPRTRRRGKRGGGGGAGGGWGGDWGGGGGGRGGSWSRRGRLRKWAKTAAVGGMKGQGCVSR